MKGYAATVDFSPTRQKLWSTATTLVQSVPEEWEARCHELTRAIAEVLPSAVPELLTVQDGMLGPQEHSWLWVGLPPPKIACRHIGCDWTAVYRTGKWDERLNNYPAYCDWHIGLYRSEDHYSPILNEGATILDTYFPGALPPVVLLSQHRGLHLARAAYCPGPDRVDINPTILSKMVFLFRAVLTANPDLTFQPRERPLRR